MIANRIHYIIFILFQFLQLILLVLYTKVNDSMIKPVLCIFIAISSLNFYLSRIIFKDSKNIYEKWILSTIFKYIFIVLIYYFCRQLIPFLIFFQNYATIIIFLVLDILRVSFIFYVRTNYESKITSYYFNDLIKLELFIQMVENSSDTSGSKLKSYEPNIYSFHENGKPKSIDLHDFFDKLVEPNEDIIFCFNRYVKNKIKFEKGHGSMITILNEEEFSAVGNKKDPNKKELRKDVFIRCFNVCGMFFFNSISYRRSENTLDFETFSENMNEICRERENLYDSIDKMFQLLEKVKIFSYFFEFILFISLMILFPSSGTLIFVFLISFCIYLVRPSIGRLAEASFFILISNPFNVNDRIKIKNEVYLVRDISLISTKLQKWCGEVTFFDNEKLSKEAIFNIMRSVSQIWEVKILVTKDIDMQSFDKFRKDLKSFCNCSNSIISIKVNFNEIINSNYLKIIFHVKHTMNYQNPFFMWVNQNKFMNYLFGSLEDYKIKYLPMDREVMVLNDT